MRIKILFLINYVSIRFIKFYSFFINIFYWIIHFNDLKNTLVLKKLIKKRINTIGDIEREIAKFKWKKEKIDWIPWVITILHRHLKDDCDGAAVYGKFLFEECLKIKADIYYLFRGTIGHAVAVTRDKKIMISNNNLVTFKMNNFEKELLNNLIFIKSYEMYLK